MPLDYPRPNLGEPVANMWQIPGDVLSTKLLGFIYAVDSSKNTFPSLHLAYTTLFSLSGERKHRFFLTLNIFLTLISTLLTKQHFVADGIAGIFLALGVYKYLEGRKSQSQLG